MTDSFAHDIVTSFIRRLSQQPAFRIYGKANYESQWQVIDVFATDRRNADSSWPFWRGHCTTLTANTMAIGWDFATEVVLEQRNQPATPHQPASVLAGRLKDPQHLGSTVEPRVVSAAELLAHECGHTAQGRRMGWLYWPIGATFTLFREGPHWWNRFENKASETGQFGGIVPGTLHPRLPKL